jgi:PAS domain S-box-containing protein
MHKKRENLQAASTLDLAVGEQMLEERRAWLNEREELVRFREQQLEARAGAEAATAERERLVVQIREANEKLVLASLRAQELAEEAIVARAAADDIAERFRSLVLTSSSLVWRATSAGRVELEHVSWRKLTGLPVSDDEWGWLDAIHPLDRDRVRAAWDDAVASAKPYECQHRIRSRKGGFAWVLARAVPIVKSGTVCEWIGMMTDVTDRVRVEEARDLFIGILGHDLRNPLTSIVGGLDLLRELPEPYARTIARLVRSSGRIQVIVRDLLDFARGRLGGGIPIVPRACDMAVIASDVIEESKQAHPKRTFRFEGTGDLTGDWDPARIEQVISNLVGNAVVHGLDPVVVTSRPEGDHVITSVHNRGTPIPDALLPTLFEPFTRAAYMTEEGQAASGVGLGLGLYISNEIVHAHGGTFSVSSSAHEGTTFTFALPRIVPRRARTTTDEQLVLAR